MLHSIEKFRFGSGSLAEHGLVLFTDFFRLRRIHFTRELCESCLTICCL
uniref:Uncharacterized protein n=1 Tax=Arundo donax TaxID=35708 RepID=A0A0A9FS42_ARUDO